MDLMALDAVLTLTPGEGATAVRHITHTWPIFDTHFPRKPVVPGVVITGCLERLAGLLLAEETGHDDWALQGLGRVRFRTFVQPGDVMELSLDHKGIADGVATFAATVTVAGSKVTTYRELRMTRRGGA